ncbi:MAG: hypothetical protein AB1324_03275 [Candidatus Micrarchaeota archaeon]
MEHKRTDVLTAKNDGKRTLKSRLAAAAVAGTLMMAPGCVPDVTINNIPYDPNATDGGACVIRTDCEAVEGYLREAGNSAGSDSLALGNGTLRFVQLVESGSSRLARVEVSGCEAEAATADVAPGASSVLTANGESFEVTVQSMDYDASGLRVRVRAVPVDSACSMDAGLDSSSDGGAGGSDGSGGEGGSG